MFGKLFRKHQKLIFITFLFILPSLPLALSRYSMPRLHLNENLSSYVVHPLANLMHSVFRGISVLSDRYLFLVSVSEHNEELVKENLELKQQLLALDETRQENTRLKRVFDMPETMEIKKVMGRIIGQSASPEHFGFFINVGKDRGLKPRMPVISAEGIVGTVIEVYPRSALFVSIVDPSHDVDGLVVRSRARTIVEGRGSPLLGRLKYLDRSEDVRVGDLVVSSGLDGVFPKGMAIGNVVSISRPQSGIVQEAMLRPAVDVGKLEEVLILMQEPSLNGQLSMNHTEN